MVTIINELEDVTFSPNDQSAIRRAATFAGAEKVYTQRESNKEEDSNLFHFYADEDFSHYLFSLDIIESEIYDKG